MVQLHMYYQFSESFRSQFILLQNALNSALEILIFQLKTLVES